MKKMAFVSSLVLLLVPLLVACSGNSVVDVAGTWTGELISSGPVDFVMDIDQAGTTLDGTLSDLAVTFSYPLAGTVNGDRIEFLVRDQDPTNPATIQFEGLVEGNSMEGWLIGDDGAGVLTGGAFNATRN